MWADERKTSLIIENTEQQTVRVSLWNEQQEICKNVGKNFT